MGLVAVALAVAGVLRAAGGTLVPPQSHGPVGEHRHAFGNPPDGLGGRENNVRQRGHGDIFKKVFSDIAEVRGKFERKTA